MSEEEKKYAKQEEKLAKEYLAKAVADFTEVNGREPKVSEVLEGVVDRKKNINNPIFGLLSPSQAAIAEKIVLEQVDDTAKRKEKLNATFASPQDSRADTGDAGPSSGKGSDSDKSGTTAGDAPKTPDTGKGDSGGDGNSPKKPSTGKQK